MDADTFFRMLFALLVIVVLGIRLLGHLKAGTFRRETSSYDEGRVTQLVRPLLIFLYLATVLYVAAPHLMAWSSVNLPLWLRFASLPLGALAIGGMAWVHSTLSKNFSAKLEIRQDHTLVTTGPYRWVRHPMYTSGVILFIAVFLLTANWFIGFAGLFSVLAVVLTRTAKEEAMLVETFGDAYRDYMQRTPRYIPRLFGDNQSLTSVSSE